MRNYLMILIAALSAATALAGDVQALQPRIATRAGADLVQNQKRDDVAKVITHLAASDDWKSMIIFRNDQLFDINLSIDFYGFDGLPASVIFRDSDGNTFETDRFDAPLAALEIYTIEFDQMSDPGLFNLTAYVFADENAQEYSVETLFSNFQNGTKVATVGGGLQGLGDSFFMNVDERFDTFTLNKKLRGVAVHNAGAETCDCNVTLWNSLGDVVGTDFFQIAPQAKWLGTVGSMVNTAGLTEGFGLLDVACNQPIGVVGLSFENNTPIVGSAPIDYYVLAKNKRLRR